MRSQSSRLLNISVSALLAGSLCLPAFADDSEIFSSTPTGTTTPNILFILDTSGSMDSHVYKRADFDPNQTYDSTYTHACDPTLVYYETGTNIPTCGTAATRRRAEVPASPSFAKSALQCTAAKDALWASTSATGTYGGTGVGDNAIRWVEQSINSSTTSTPSTSTRVRTTTSSYISTQVVTQPYQVTLVVTRRSSGSLRYSWGTETSNGAASASPATNSATTSTTTPWGAATVTASGAPGTTSSTTTSSGWRTTLVAPASSTVTTTSTGSPGTPTTTTTSTGSFAPGTPSVSHTPNPFRPSPLPTATGTFTYPFTRTTTTVTPYSLVVTETEATPITTSSTTTATTYTATDIECDGDKATGTAGKGYPNNVAPTSTQWTNNKPDSYWDTGGGLQQYTFYSGNYLNYLVTGATVDEGTRIDVMKSAIGTVLDGLTGKNVGLMRYSNNSNSCDSTCELQAQGGMVTYAMSSVDTNRTTMKSVVNSYLADGWTPLSETMFEAFRYYSGGDVLYGNTSEVYDNNAGAYVSSPSVAESRTTNTLAGTQYKTPITGSCQNNYIVYLTDGLPTQDTQASSLIRALPGFAADGGTCNSDTANGGCLSALAQYMYKHDLNSALDGDQIVRSYFVGFGDDFTGAGGDAAFSYLEDAATRGGGLAYSAADSAELADKLKAALGNIAAQDTSFAAPSVAINAFNRTQTLNDLFISVFKPTSNLHWQGNIKKYHVDGTTIRGQDGAVALNSATGFFNQNALSYWTSGDPDGANTALSAGNGDGFLVSAGGAAHRIPAPSLRKVYTYISSTNKPSSSVDLTASTNSFAVANTAITASLLGDSTMTSAQRDNLINWALGQDTEDRDNPNSITSDTRSVMGDPMHARPAVVIYGGTSSDPDTVVFAPTNDGYLHAIGGKDNDGAELWSFIPQELLPGLKALHDDLPTTNKHYALDGDIVVAKYDINGDGVIDAASGDRVVLFFSQGRGGSYYYALDVTDKNTPKFLWSLGPSDLPGIGQSWSAPALTRVNISGATQTPQKLVLIFGGGYDPSEESAGYRTANSVGNHIYMVEARTGELLWSASSSGADLNISRMDHSIPSNINVMDLDNDGFADRMYVGDMAGQVFRFDITNGQTRANLVAGGVIASLGTHDDSTHAAADNRRFYNAPDVALVAPIGAANYFSVSIGSGYRGHPLNTTIQDRFYSLRDKKPFTKMTQTEYNNVMASSVVHDSNMTDITTIGSTVPNNSPGWKLLLNDPSWQGEKSLSTSVTFDNKILFTTYTPSGSSTPSADGCSTTTTGTNRSYAISVFDGGPVKEQGEDFDHSCTAGNCTAQDRYDDLHQGGIASGIVILFPGNGNGDSSSSSSSDSSGSSGSSGSSSSSSSCSTGDCITTMCLAGTETVICPPNRGVYKTFWHELTSP